MGQRFTFTTRDWFWLCLVMFLAMGWGSHVRYSLWYDSIYVNATHPYTDDNLRAKMNEAVGQARDAKNELHDLILALAGTLDQEQRAIVDAARIKQKQFREQRDNP